MPHKSSEEIEIREIELDDLGDIYRLGEKVFTSEDWPTLYRTWDEYEVVDAFMHDRETSLVAEFEGSIIGFALGSLINKPRNSWVYGYLEWLGVDPDFGRRGAGRTLVKEIRHVFIEQGARMLLVDTEMDNEPAIRLFRSLGFGSDAEHVYLTLNLTNQPDYQRHRAKHK